MQLTCPERLPREVSASVKSYHDLQDLNGMAHSNGTNAGRKIQSWSTRRLPSETNTEYLFRMLLIDLQMLAADAEVLFRAFYPPTSACRDLPNVIADDFVNIVADDLANDFNTYLEMVSGAAVAEGLVSEERVDVVRRVDGKLGEMSGAQNADLWTDQALRTSNEWSVIRRLAKEAILALGHRVEPPPPWSGRIVPAR